MRGGLVREDPARPKDSTPTKSNGSLEENKKRYETTVLEKMSFFYPVKCPFNVKEFLLFWQHHAEREDIDVGSDTEVGGIQSAI